MLLKLLHYIGLTNLSDDQVQLFESRFATEDLKESDADDIDKKARETAIMTYRNLYKAKSYREQAEILELRAKDLRSEADRIEAATVANQPISVENQIKALLRNDASQEEYNKIRRLIDELDSSEFVLNKKFENPFESEKPYVIRPLTTEDEVSISRKGVDKFDQIAASGEFTIDQMFPLEETPSGELPIKQKMPPEETP